MGEYKYDEALSVIKNFEKKVGISDEDKLSILFMEGLIYFYTGNWKEVVRVGDTAYQICQEFGGIRDTIEALFFKAMMMHLGKFNEALEFILEAEILIERLARESNSNFPQERAVALMGKSWVYVYKGESNMALELALKGIAFREDIEEKDRKYKSIYLGVDPDLLLTYVYISKGDFNSALDHAVKSVKLQKQNQNKIATAGSLRALGLIHSYKGDLDSSIKYCNQALSISNISNFNNFNTFTVLGRNYKIKGELNRALKYLERANELSMIIGYKHPMLADSLVSIGNIYFMKGDYKKSEEFVTRALKFSEEIGFYGRYMALSLFWLVLIYLEKKMDDKSQLYLSKLKELANKTEISWFNHAYLTAKALVLKTSRRTRNRAEAEILLKQIIEQENIDFDIYILSLVSLCEFHLEELENSNEPEIIDEINPLIRRLFNIAESTSSYLLLAEAKTLQAKLALILLNFEETTQLLTEAQRIAEMNGLQLLARKISQEHDILLEKIDEWEKLKNNDAPMADRIELASFDGVIKRLQGKGTVDPPEIVNEDPILLLIMDKSGVPYFNHSFEKNWDYNDIFSSFMSAFNTFSDELFSKSIDRIKIGENTILINPIEQFLACYVIKGQSYPAQQKLTRFSDTIKTTSEIWDALTKALDTGKMLQLDDPPSLRSCVNEIFTL
jgi:tetratricopeptide (TPR) repeat protein